MHENKVKSCKVDKSINRVKKKLKIQNCILMNPSTSTTCYLMPSALIYLEKRYLCAVIGTPSKPIQKNTGLISILDMDSTCT